MAIRFATEAEALWIPTDGPAQENTPDRYAALRGRFELAADVKVSLRVFGADFFVAWLDGEYLTEGPFRFPPSHPEYETVEISLARGRHVLAALVRNEGIETRILQGQFIPPFFMAQVLAGDANVPISWKAQRLPGYLASGQHVSPQFAWVEWVDTRRNPPDWQKPAYDDADWAAPIEVAQVRTWDLQPIDAEKVKRLKIAPKLIDQGNLSGPFDLGEKPDWQTEDDPSWYQRDRRPSGQANGVWRQYDLGYVKLGTPEFTLELPPGVVVEIAYSETRREGRVTPFIPLSCGLSRNLDHFISRGGMQTFSPIVPKGGRYLEIHVGAPPGQVRFIGENYWQRTYYDVPSGEFRCGDPRLNRVWQLGIDTLRGCSEDAIIDNPTRERGQWTGDLLLALDIAAAGFNDVRLFKRGLRQAAFCARPDGLVAGLSPGGPTYPTTYAAQWTTAAVNYYTMTGDRGILEELYPHAVRNMSVFAKELTPEGIPNFAWTFVDWGYPDGEDGSTDVALNCHVLEASRSMQIWCRLLQKDDAPYRDLEARLQAAIAAQLHPRLAAGAWEKIGYHDVTLALRNGLVPEDQRSAAVAYLKRHMLACFPNNPDAPRLLSPAWKGHQIITPYFAHYSLAELAAAGEIDFALDQLRTCWGWGLDEGLTTQPEVFSLDWSHCHVWASSPTAHLTRWLLGLQPRFSRGLNHFEFTLKPGSVDHVSGKIPFTGQSGALSVTWKKTTPDQIIFQIDTPQPIWIHTVLLPNPVAVRERAQLTVRLIDETCALRVDRLFAEKSDKFLFFGHGMA